MSEIKMYCPAVPNMPWVPMPDDLPDAPVWRYPANPIIGRNPLPGVARIFNSAVMPYNGEFIGVFRGEQTNGIPYIYLGHSKDGIDWKFDEEKINFVDEAGKPFMPRYAYDPRLVKVEDTYYISSGAAISTERRSTLLRRRISRHLPVSRIRSSRITEMRCCSRGRSAETSFCFRVPRTADTHLLAISS